MHFFPFKARASWWIKIHTEIPQCVYYFGPFTNASEAQNHQVGYIEDLMQEGAQGINVATHRGKPKALTIFEEVDN